MPLPRTPPVGHDKLMGGGRRRSASESDGDVMNSTLNPSQACQLDRNNEISTSTPQINVSGFIDDSYRNNLGTRLQTRIHTRSKGDSRSNELLRSKYLKLRDNINEWGVIDFTPAQSMQFIDFKYDGFCRDIDQCIEGFLLARGDPILIGELNSLKDRLKIMKRRAAAVIQDAPVIEGFGVEWANSQQSGIVQPNQTLSRSMNSDNVFRDDPGEDRTDSNKSLPVHLPRVSSDLNLSRVTSPMENISRDTVVAPRSENRIIAVDTGSTCARQDLDTLETNPCQYGGNNILKTRPSNLVINPTLPLSDTLDGQHGALSNPQIAIEIISNYTDFWMSNLRSNQTLLDEKVENLSKTVKSVELSLQGMDILCNSTRNAVQEIIINNSEVLQKIDYQAARLDNFEEESKRMEAIVLEKIRCIQVWVEDIREKSIPEVPAEIISSLQEVINDSAPGIAVESMRGEMRELRRTVVTGQQMTEGLQNIVIDLSDQIRETSVMQSQPGDVMVSRMVERDDSNSKEREVVRKGIERLEKQLRQLTNSEINEEPLDIPLIKKCKTVDVPSIHNAVEHIQKAVQRYIKFPGSDDNYVDYVTDLLDNAANWCSKVEILYNKAEIHSINSSKGDTNDVGVFSDNAKVTIYEFLNSAEIAYMGWGNSRQRANRLYNRHLSEEIKSKLINKSDSYQEMRQWLILQYGGASRIISDIVNDLAARPKPGANDSNARFSFFSHITGALQRVERLSKIAEINKQELETCLYSRSTLNSLSLVLPQKTYMNWITKMTENGLDYKNPTGAEAYIVFKNLCTIERNTSEGSRIPEKMSSPKTKPRSPKTKNKSAFKVQELREESSDDEAGVFASFHNKKWYSPNLKFPCPVGKHQHELNTCAEFFAMNPVERWNKMDKGKICYSCLAPKDVCTTRRCSRENRVPESLKCHGCAPWASSKNLAPFSILFCRNKEHAGLRADFKDIKRDLEKYMGKLGTAVADASIKFSVNYMNQVHAAGPPSANGLGWKVEDFKDKPAPTINSETGEKVEDAENDVIPEVSEHSCYLMQTIKIGNSEALVFYDRGANIHIIDGSLAAEEDLQQVSDTPTSLTVVGGKKVKSHHGTYRFNLGPGDRGEFHEIVCVGMDDVTAGFGSYDLSEISEEFKMTADETEKDEILPKQVGGSKVHLLLGIKNTNLDPVLIRRLPSGIAVYRSPFKDIYGSRIIFAGPHKSFSDVNPMSNAVFFMRQKIDDEFQHGIEERYFSIITNKVLNTTIHPHPISEYDVVECNGLVPEQFEDTTDDTDVLIKIMDGGDYMCSAHRAHVPMAKYRNAIADQESDVGPGFRCADCAKCLNCKVSSKRQAISLQEAREQEFIEKSVKIDIKERKVIVNYPFLREPIKFLTDRHHGRSNYAQAERVYMSQCRKNDKVKEGMRKVHQDLVDKGFMVKLDELERSKQELVVNAQFQHFNPWRLVMKSDSVSTPVRMVVDPSMTGFNNILAKGENRIGLIFTILIRCRCTEFVWSSDISKLYNQLILDDPSLPYSLFLYNEALDPKKKPDIWVMVRAWYGIVSTGGQAGFALDKLTEMMKDEFPQAYKPLRENRYVDDLLSGDDTSEGRDEQILAVEEVLKRGGFSLKFVVKSGEKPSEKASADGESLKLLGYKWDSEADILSPGLGELNLNKKVRGEKKPNSEPVRTVLEAEKLLENVQLTRSMIVGKISEFFDPCGFFEPIKVQMKLQTSGLKGRDWEEILPEEEQKRWKNILKDYVNLPEIQIPRFCLPSSKISKSKIRLICLADAAECVGGAAIYAGKELSPGNWSCSLLAAKSKMMSETIPRNELSAILLCAELAFMVKVALEDQIGEIIFVTDSTIAMSWCSNPTIQLRLFVYNRVMTILRLFEWTTGSKKNPLFHVDGNLNLADLLTKKHELGIEDVSMGSAWIEGLDWMKKDKSDMPLLEHAHLIVEKPIIAEVMMECFPEPGEFSKSLVQVNSGEDDSDDDSEEMTIPFSVLALRAGRGMVEPLVDPVYHGWRKALRITGYLQSWSSMHKHKDHKEIQWDCKICMLGSSLWDPTIEEKRAQDYFFRWETSRIKANLDSKVLSKYAEKDGILYEDGRLGAEFQFDSRDLDQVNVDYLDKHEILNPVPIVWWDSPVLYSYLMLIHTKSSMHAALEPTVKEVHKMMRVPRGLRGLIKKIIADCIRCRIIAKKTVELKMANHPRARTTLAPCFHSCMMDICYGFKGQAYKRARTVVKIYGLVIVCLMSGATNIMALEGIETQDVCMAVDKHSNRYGVPGFIYVDNGTQLKALQHANFSIRDLEAQVRDSLGIKIIVSNAKAHSERGRVERRIRTLRETLEKLGVQTSDPMTCMQWDTLFSRISNTIDNLPIARGDTSNGTLLGYEIITPNRLKLGRNNHRSLEGCINLEMSPNFTKLLDRNRSVYRSWFQTFVQNVHNLNLCPNKWLRSSRLPVMSDLVLFVLNDGNLSKDSVTWKLGRVLKVENTKVSILTSGKTKGSEQTFTRSVRDVSIVYSEGEMLINTVGHFDECIRDDEEN